MEYIFLRCSSICTSGKYWKSNEFGHGKGHREVAYCLLCEKKFESMVTICVPRFRPKRERERKARRFYPYKVIVCIIHIDRSNRSCCRFAMPSFPFHPSPDPPIKNSSALLWQWRNFDRIVVYILACLAILRARSHGVSIPLVTGRVHPS